MQGTCANVIIADLTPSPSDPLLHPHMLSYTTYLGAFQNSSARAGPNALAFQGCSGICCILVCAVLHVFFPAAYVHSFVMLFSNKCYGWLA